MLFMLALLTALATLNGSATLNPFPVQIGAQVPTAGGAVTAVDPSLIVTGVVGAVAAWNTIKGHKTAQTLDAKHAISEDRTAALATGLSAVLGSLKATDIAGKDQAVIVNQLVQALNTVPAVAEVLQKPIKDVAPSTASEGDATQCLVEKVDNNAKDHKDDITNYYDNKPAISGDTSSDPVVRAVASVQKETVKTYD